MLKKYLDKLNSEGWISNIEIADLLSRDKRNIAQSINRLKCSKKFKQFIQTVPYTDNTGAIRNNYKITHEYFMWFLLSSIGDYADLIIEEYIELYYAKDKTTWKPQKYIKYKKPDLGHIIKEFEKDKRVCHFLIADVLGRRKRDVRNSILNIQCTKQFKNKHLLEKPGPANIKSYGLTPHFFMWYLFKTTNIDSFKEEYVNYLFGHKSND